MSRGSVSVGGNGSAARGPQSGSVGGGNGAAVHSKERKAKVPAAPKAPAAPKVEDALAEGAKRPDVVAAKIANLEQLHIKARDAAKATTEAIKAVAAASGYSAATIKRLVTARVGDKFDDMVRDSEQQLELFSEVGED